MEQFGDLMKESIGKNISVRPNFTKFRCRIMPSKLFVVCMMRLIHIKLCLPDFVEICSSSIIGVTEKFWSVDYQRMQVRSANLHQVL